MQKVKVIKLSLRQVLRLCLRRTLQVLKCLPGVASTSGPLWGLEKSCILKKEAVALRGVTKPPAIFLNVSVYLQCQKTNLFFPLCFHKKPLCPLKNLSRSLWLTYRINRDGNLSGSVRLFLLEWLMVLTHGVLFPNTRNVLFSNILQCSNGGHACSQCHGSADGAVTS